jgi:hypothetical protein
LVLADFYTNRNATFNMILVVWLHEMGSKQSRILNKEQIRNSANLLVRRAQTAQICAWRNYKFLMLLFQFFRSF